MEIRKYWPLLTALAGAAWVAAMSAAADGWDWAPDGTRTGMALAAALVVWMTANGPTGSGWRAAKSAAVLVTGVGGTFLVVYADHVLTAPDWWALGTAAGVALGVLPAPPSATAFDDPRTPRGTPAVLTERAGYRVP